MSPIQLQTPEEMLERWAGVDCTCDHSVGHLCELCHDTQVVRELIAELKRVKDGVNNWSYCASIGMKSACPERVDALADFLISCGVAPYYITPRG